MDSIPIQFYPREVTNPFILTLFEFTKTSIEYDGYWYLEDEVFSEARPPVRRILHVGITDVQGSYLIEVTKKVSGQDTSGDGTEEDPIFFPTNLIKLEIKLVRKLLTSEDEKAAANDILSAESELRTLHEKIKRKKHEEDIERFKHLDYKSFLNAGP